MKVTFWYYYSFTSNYQIYFNRVFNVVLFGFTASRGFIDPTPVPEKLNDAIYDVYTDRLE